MTEQTPHHASFTVIRQRLSPTVYVEVFAVVLRALKQKKLHKGKRLAINTSVLEANTRRCARSTIASRANATGNT